MSNRAFHVAVLLFVMTASGFCFEPYDYKKVPSPGIEDTSDAQYQSLVDTLARIAANSEIPDSHRARILAAARRISPLNKDAFTIEYLLSIGEPPGDFPKVAKEEVNSSLQPFIKDLTAVAGAQEYLKFLSEAVSFDDSTPPILSSSGDDPFADESDAAVETTASVNTCSLLTMEGCEEVSCRSTLISGTKFQFDPGPLKSSIFMSAYWESLKYLAMSKSAGLVGQRVSFQTEADLTEEEGPSSALACAVMTHAVAENCKIDPLVAFSGDVNADGTVQPLDDQKDRLTASPTTLSLVVVIPKADRYSADDILLLHGPSIFYNTQLFTVGNLNEAIDIGRKDRSENLTNALKTFYQVQQVLKKPDGRKYLKNSHVRQRLEETLELAPNHLSARQLKKVSMGRYPAHLSLEASFEIVFDALRPVIEDGEIDEYGKLDPEGFATLKRYRNRLDPSIKKLTAATFSFETAGRIGTNSSNERARVRQRLKEELMAISRNVKIRERLM